MVNRDAISNTATVRASLNSKTDSAMIAEANSISERARFQQGKERRVYGPCY